MTDSYDNFIIYFSYLYARGLLLNRFRDETIQNHHSIFWRRPRGSNPAPSVCEAKAIVMSYQDDQPNLRYSKCSANICVEKKKTVSESQTEIRSSALFYKARYTVH